jgi:hypothetical protein
LARHDTASTTQGKPVTVAVLANDHDPDDHPFHVKVKRPSTTVRK